MTLRARARPADVTQMARVHFAVVVCLSPPPRARFISPWRKLLTSGTPSLTADDAACRRAADAGAPLRLVLRVGRLRPSG